MKYPALRQATRARRSLIGWIVIALGSGVACVAPVEVPPMGSARITSDFSTYQVRRVGVVPFQAVEAMGLGSHEIGAIETSFQTELAASTTFELVPLRGTDLDEVLPPDPFRKGWYTPETIRTLRDRYRLDALMVGSITSRKVVPPQVLGIRLDLVSCETGATIWSSSLHLDASRQETRDAIELWAANQLGDQHASSLALLSPLRFAQFAAYQMARML